jgi:UDP-3-O-[3-hydroxymyristoyl] glucosamine N-acyltransferase
LTLRELAERLGCRLEGDGAIEIVRVSGIEDAGPGDLTFFVNPRYAPALRTTRASAVILGEDAPPAPCAMLRTRQPYLAFANALAFFAPEDRPHPGIHPRAWVDPSAVCAPDAYVGPFVSIGAGARVGARSVLHALCSIGPGAVVGDDCLLHSRVTLRERVVLGNRVIVQDGAVIGADGYGFAQRADGTHQKIPQIGTVVIEDDVEIGANSAVDRPPVGETRIRSGTKIDNLVQIAHGVTIGRDVLIAAQTGIAGSTALEDRVVLAGQVGVAGHVTIGRDARATAQTGIPNSVPAGAFVSGYPAIDNSQWLKSSAVFRRLPELRRTVNDLERRLTELEARLSGRASA